MAASTKQNPKGKKEVKEKLSFDKEEEKKSGKNPAPETEVPSETKKLKEEKKRQSD